MITARVQGLDANASSGDSDSLSTRRRRRSAEYYYDYATTPNPGPGPFPVYGSGTLYIIRHAETSGSVSPSGIGPKGIRRAEYIATIFDGSKYKAPKSIIAGHVSGTAQRMEDTVAPLAKKLGITIDTSIKVDDDEDGAHQAKRDLDHGTVLVCWWSYVVQFCAWLGPHCDNFSGNDSVLVVEIKDGKVTSMTLDAEGFVDPGFEDEMSEEFENAGAIV